MSIASIIALTAAAMLAFAANSLLCRAALVETSIDAATFTAVRVVSGALVLVLLVALRDRRQLGKGSWSQAIALFVYAAGFSFAYVDVATGTGALLLFGAVQLTMIGYGVIRGERPSLLAILGIALALVGLVVLLMPGATAPPLQGAGLMVVAGVAWGAYSLFGRGARQPLADTAGNFLRAAPMAVVLFGLAAAHANPDPMGLLYAVLSGAIASGLGYAVWYRVLPHLLATQAATIQLSVPVIAALAGIVFLAEPLTLRLVGAAVLTLGGIAMVLRTR